MPHTDGGGGCGGGCTRLLLLFLLCAAARCSAEALHPAVGGVRALLRALHSDGFNCSLIVLADHTTIADAVIQGVAEGYAGGGTTLLRLPANIETEDDNAGNKTRSLDHHLKRLIKMGRQIRYTNRCISVLFVTNSVPVLSAMLNHSTEDRLMLWSSHGIIVTELSESAAVEAAAKEWAFTMMNCHLLLMQRPGSKYKALLYRHEPYSPVGGRTVLVGYYTQEPRLIIALPLIHDKFRNFFGGNVTFTALPYLPFIDVIEIIQPDGTKTFEFAGTDYKLLLTLAAQLNFTPTYISWPVIWDEVQHEVTIRKSFISSCMHFMTSVRLDKFDVIAPYTTKDLAFTMFRPKTISSWDSFMWPFLYDVWLLIMGLLFIVSGALLMILKFSTADDVITSKLRGGLQLRGVVAQVPKGRALFELYGSLIGQDFVFKMPNTHSFRILITTWFIFIIVLSTGYKSKLISFMTLPKQPFRPETVRELVESNAMIPAPPYGRDYANLLLDSSSADLKTVGNRYLNIPNMDTVIQMVLTEGMATMNKRRHLSYEIADKFTLHDGSTDLYVGRESLLTLLSSLPIPHDAPFKRHFDDIMLDIVQGGLYNLWHEQELANLHFAKAEAKKKQNSSDAIEIDNSPIKPLRFDQVLGTVYIILLGNLLATFCLLAEMIVVKTSKVRNKSDKDASTTEVFTTHHRLATNISAEPDILNTDSPDTNNPTLYDMSDVE